MKFKVGDLVRDTRFDDPDSAGGVMNTQIYFPYREEKQDYWYADPDSIGVVVRVDEQNASAGGVMNTQVCFPCRKEKQDHWYADDELTLVRGDRNLGVR